MCLNFRHILFLCYRIIPMQLAVPIAVSAAVRIDTITCITVFQVSLFIVLNSQIIILNCHCNATL